MGLPDDNDNGMKNSDVKKTDVEDTTATPKLSATAGCSSTTPNSKLTSPESPTPQIGASFKIERESSVDNEDEVHPHLEPPVLDRCDDLPVESPQGDSAEYDSMNEDGPPVLDCMIGSSSSATLSPTVDVKNDDNKESPAEKREDILSIPDWNEKLRLKYGDPEIAKTKPWFTDEENAMFATLPVDKKVAKMFTLREVTECEVSSQKRSLFELPSHEGLTPDQVKVLKYIDSSCALYRTMSCHGTTKTLDKNKKPLFLPFLRRNLRYNKSLPSKKDRASQENQSNDGFDSTQDDTLTCCQDIVVKLVSIRHNLLPTGHFANISFFYTMRDLKTQTFSPIRKIASATVTIEVKDEVPPVVIDMPPDCEFSRDEAKEIFVILRVSFFEQSQDASCGRSLRNVPARLAGQCERARDQKDDAKRSENRSSETVMFGTYQIIEFNTDWVCHGGTMPVTLVEEEKLREVLKTRHWKSDGKTVLSILSLAKKLHSNPFVHLNVKSADDDETTIKSGAAKRRKLEPEDEHVEEQKAAEVKVAKEKAKAEVTDDFDYQFPPCVIYQLDINMLKVQTVPPKKRRTKKQLLRTPQQPPPPEPLPLFKQQALRSPVIQKALTMLNLKAPQPEKFVYCTVQEPNCCVFCRKPHKNLFALMWHLETCHSRFSYVYKSAIEYKPGHYCPGFLMKLSQEDDDNHSRNRKSSFQIFNGKWPQQFLLNDRFCTPCHALFRNVTDGLNVAMTRAEFNDYLNNYGPRPLNLKYTPSGRLDSTIPHWTLQKVIRGLNEIIDLDPLERKYFIMWNKFVIENGRPCGKEHDYYKLCRMFLEQNRERIQEELVTMPMLCMFTYFSHERMICVDEFYDLCMRLNRNYDPETDALHPLQDYYLVRIRKAIARAKLIAYREAHRRPKKEYNFGETTRVLRSKAPSSSRENASTEPIACSSTYSHAIKKPKIEVIPNSSSCPGALEDLGTSGASGSNAQ